MHDLTTTDDPLVHACAEARETINELYAAAKERAAAWDLSAD